MKQISRLCLVLFSLSFSLSTLADDKCRTAFSEKEASPMKAKIYISHPTTLSRFFDHTLLKPEASWPQIKGLVEEAVQYKLKAVCVNSCRVKEVTAYLSKIERKDSSLHIPLVAATIGFPLGAVNGAIKMREADRAIREGAQELDMVINIGFLKDGKIDALREDIRSVTSFNTPVKAILETDVLTKEEIVVGSKVAVEAGAKFVKTSTGFIPGGKGALLENIKLMQEGINQADLTNSPYQKSEIEIKASGGVKTLEQAVEFIKAGVTRIGSSSSLAIMDEAIKKWGLEKDPAPDFTNITGEKPYKPYEPYEPF